MRDSFVVLNRHLLQAQERYGLLWRQTINPNDNTKEK
jgi:hypothetical protein